MRLRINQFIISLILLIISCNNRELGVVERQIKSIDKIPVSLTYYVIEVDSIGSITDTLALRKLKYDDDQNLIFENNIQLKSNLETLNYYDAKNGMIFSEVRKEGEKFSDFKVDLEDELIVSAIYNVYHNEIKDSVLMKYQYVFDEGKITKLVIDSGDGFNTIELYNELEKPIMNFSIDKNDTIKKTDFVYEKNGMIKEKRFKDFSQDEETFYKYENGFVVNESHFSKGIEKYRTEFTQDEQGNYLSYTEEF